MTGLPDIPAFKKNDDNNKIVEFGIDCSNNNDSKTSQY